MSDNNWSDFAVGFGIGLLGGFLVAILLTPQSGHKTREIVLEKADDLRDMVKEATADRKKVYTETWRQPKAKPYNSEFK